MRLPRRTLTLTATVVAALALSACDLDDDTGSVDAPDPESATCPAGEFFDDEGSIFVSAHAVSGGQLGDVCLGDEQDVLADSWAVLEAVAPREVLADVAVLAGFEGDDTGDSETLAYVHPLDDARTRFQMSVNLGAAERDENELHLTLVHEFAHVFTEAADQYDLDADADTCDGWFAAEGCHPAGSWLADWVDEFWSDDDLANLSDNPNPSDGDERCSLDRRYLGAYAASTPEEDFAETFSAFVLDVDVTDVDAKLAFFADRDLAVTMRDNAVDAGLTPATNSFERCG